MRGICRMQEAISAAVMRRHAPIKLILPMSSVLLLSELEWGERKIR
jgi:hypothetical protein